jgi:hypothetical protein
MDFSQSKNIIHMGISGMSNDGWGEYGDLDEGYLHQQLRISELRLQRTEELLKEVLNTCSPEIGRKIREYFNPFDK